MLGIPTQELVNPPREMGDHLRPLGFEPISKLFASSTAFRSSDERHWQVLQRAEFSLDPRRRGLFTLLEGSPSASLSELSESGKPAAIASNFLFGNFLARRLATIGRYLVFCPKGANYRCARLR